MKDKHPISVTYGPPKRSFDKTVLTSTTWILFRSEPADIRSSLASPRIPASLMIITSGTAGLAGSDATNELRASWNCVCVFACRIFGKSSSRMTWRLGEDLVVLD